MVNQSKQPLNMSKRETWVKQTPKEEWLLRVGLLAWMGVLLLATNGQQSLVAHDEGWYALQARWMLESGDWITPQWWGAPIYDRTVGLQWAIAACYTLFGISDGVARLISFAASLLAVQLTYAIGKRLFPPLLDALRAAQPTSEPPDHPSGTIQSRLTDNRVAALAAAVLSVCPLWLDYSRMATQDVPLVCVELLLIWALLRAEEEGRSRWLWGLLAGSLVGIGFLIKSVMIIIPLVALLPYWVAHGWWQRRSPTHHFNNPGLYLGLVLGFIPFAAWFAASTYRYGSRPWQELFGHLFTLGSKQFHADGGIVYYFWNVPANAFPWALFALGGFALVVQRAMRQRHHWFGNTHLDLAAQQPEHDSSALPTPGVFSQSYLYWRSQTLLAAYPILLLSELTVFSTRTAYYGLQLYPWIGFLTAISCYWLSQMAPVWVPKTLSYLFTGLGGLVLGLAIAVGMGVVHLPSDVLPYVPVAVVPAVAWISLPFVCRRQTMWQWVGLYVLGSWLALAIAGFLGLWGNYSPDVKAFVQQPAIQAELQIHPVNLIIPKQVDGEVHKSWVLVSFYTPRLGQQLPDLADLPPLQFAWIREPLPNPIAYRQFGQVQGWQLIQRL